MADDDTKSEKSQDVERKGSKSPPSRPKSGTSSKGRSPSPGKGSRATSGSKTPKSPTTQRKSPKPGSAKSREKSPKGKKGASKGKAKKDSEVREEPTEGEEEKEGLPENVIPIFFSAKTQEIFSIIVDNDVTEDEPNKVIPKDDIIQDMKTRAAISDFHPVKQTILDYPGDDVLVIYDPDFKYGQNFCIALTEEAKEKILHPPEEEGEGDTEPEEEVVYKYIPPEPKEWISQGSEVEVEEENVVVARKTSKFTVTRVRRDFGVHATFTDRNAGDAKDGFIECTSYEDKSFNIKKVEIDSGTQAIPTLIENGSQTEWKHPRNASTQYTPREFSEEEKEKISSSKTVNKFVEEVAPRFELCLQQNEIMDVFFDDWMALADEDSTFGSKSDNHLKEYQSFTDLQFSKEKTITCVDWHPSIKGVIAVSCAERLSFDERVDNSSKVLMTPSLILVWSFTDPIHPQLLLEAPDDIFCFKFNPVDPNIVAGGCINGQVVLWDITRWADRLKNTPRGKQMKKNTMMSLLPLARLDGGSGEYGPTRISIREKQGDRSILDNSKSDQKPDTSTTHLSSTLRTGSAKDKKLLDNVVTKFYVGTEDGELVYCDWKYDKDPDSGKLAPVRPDWCKLLHDSSINTLQRSPFFKDIILCVGGWNFTIWKEGVEYGPLLASSASHKKLTAGRWSPSRPGVFYIAKQDGNVDVWDILDRTHEPSLTQNVTAASITSIYPWAVSNKQHLLAIADGVGTLHILEIPWTLRHASTNEVTSVSNYFDREVKRLEFVEERRQFRILDKRRIDADEAARKAAKPQIPDQAEIDMKMKFAFDAYEEMEKKFLEELGLIIEPEEPLPEV
ncbi:dynein axonemal intermediate chain 3-like [Saccoglossus kowalevskii]|uniref:WD repeat-containing protein 63-like n=1 Tax=Saccoglossus kowalevskii TaxID=10224 RepID=A0ABM0GYG5_SACKO|nr:PREDICTED: WD repeat-containing protein 63-like [Saccoglossus kowalevskii]